MLLKAPAKINLSLRILSRRADGYHEISSLMRAIRLFDEVEVFLSTGITPRPYADTDRPLATDKHVSSDLTGVSEGECGQERSMLGQIRVSTDMPGVPEGPENLAYRAAALALEAWGAAAQNVAQIGQDLSGPHAAASPALEAWDDEQGFVQVDIYLKKNIPMAAGLAGGSADAAAVLLGLAKVLSPETGLPGIAALASSLGADLPFCVYTCAAANPGLGYDGACVALAEGVGERITPVADAAAGDARIILAKPDIEIRASEAYALYDTLFAPEEVFAGGPKGSRVAVSDSAPGGSIAAASGNVPRGSIAAPSGNDLEGPCAAVFAGGPKGSRVTVSDSAPGGSISADSGNDLEGPCARAWPEVQDTLDALKSICAEEGAANALVQLSGSGPTVFAYFDDGAFAADPEAALRVYARLKAVKPGLYTLLTRTL